MEFTLKVKKDEIIERVKSKLDARSKIGQFDYGTTLMDNKGDDYLAHLQSELLDGANYIEAMLEHQNHRTINEMVKFGNYLLSGDRNSDKKHVTDVDLKSYYAL